MVLKIDSSIALVALLENPIVRFWQQGCTVIQGPIAIAFFRTEDRGGTGVNESLDLCPQFANGFENIDGADHVDHGTQARIELTAWYLEACQMNHMGYLSPFQSVLEMVTIANIALHKLHAFELKRV